MAVDRSGRVPRSRTRDWWLGLSFALGTACNGDDAGTVDAATDEGSASAGTTAPSTSAMGTSSAPGTSEGSDGAPTHTASTGDTSGDDASTAGAASSGDATGTGASTGVSESTGTTGGMLIPCSESSWGTPVSLQAVADDVTNAAPYLVVDHAGNVTALWNQFYPGGPDPDFGPQFNRFEPANGGWQGAAAIDPAQPWQSLNGAVVDGWGDVTVVVSTVGDVFSEKLAYRYDVEAGVWGNGEPISGLTSPTFHAGPAVDASGNVFVVLEDTSGALRVARYDRTVDTWALDTTVSAPGHTVHIYGDPDLAVAPGGDAFVVYGATSGVPHTWAVRYDGGTGTWSDVHDLGSSAQLPVVAAQADGTALALWREILPSDGVYHYRASAYDSAGGTWTSPMWVEQLGTGSTTEARVDADDAGGFLVSLRRGGELHTDRYEQGVGFGAATQHTAFGNATSSGRLVPAPGGEAWAFWGELDGTHGRVIGRRFDAVQGWDEPATIDDDQNDDAALRHVVVDDAGTPTVVWRQAEGSVGHLRASCYDAELGAWSTPQDVETSLELTAHSAAVVDGSGAVTAIWHQYAANQRTIWANRSE